LRPDESFAIADMRSIPFAEPHYHQEEEIYFVLHGTGLIVIGGKEEQLKKGSVVVIPSNIAHFTIPHEDLVLAVVNTPPFVAEHYTVVKNTNKRVKFDKEQFDQLINQR
jgi:mannose-6-phosphate isomerase-like protein (cupin superfamily)